MYPFGTRETGANRPRDHGIYDKPLPAKAILKMELAGLEPATSWCDPDLFVPPCPLVSTKCLHIYMFSWSREDAGGHE
jgi:hypothetical protein